MRSLSITRYHHFSYLVISTALLGFGVSGTYLTFAEKKFTPHFARVSLIFFVLFTVMVPLGYAISQIIPLDIQYLLYSPYQVLLLILFNLCIFLPFFFGAVIIGLSLSHFEGHIPVVYGFNLLGSGVGGVAALLAMHFVPATYLPGMIAGAGMFALICWVGSTPAYLTPLHRKYTFLLCSISVLVTVGAIVLKPPVAIDQYKSLSHLRRLEQQSDAERILTRYGPRGRIDVYASQRIHQTLFAGLSTTELPPEQMALLYNGQLVGTIFQAEHPGETGILDFTPQSLPYRLLSDRSSQSDSLKVLLLGEVDGTNVWLAQRYGADIITVVQPNSQIVEIMQETLSEQNGNIFNRSNVKVVQKDPHLFLKQTARQFDIIQVVSAEQIASASSGINSLHEDYLLTVQSLIHAYRRLTPQGIITVTRGIQTPPRDNIKIFALFTAALEKAGIRSPGEYLAQTRNYLAVHTMLFKQPMTEELIDSLKRTCVDLLMDTEYYPGIRSEDVSQINEIPGPSGKAYSYYHHAAQQILSGNRSEFMESWMYQVEPSTDNKPYFHNFFQWQSVHRFMEVYGRYWLQRLELGYVVLVVTLLEVSVIAFLFILLPLVRLRTGLRRSKNKLPALLHFGGIGFAFLFLEMVFIQKFTNFLGDPVYSATAILTAILVFAGLGSSLQHELPGNERGRIRFAAVAIVLLACFSLLGLDPVLDLFIQAGTLVRFLVAIIVLFPLSFFMGWMFPSGLTLLERHSGELIPWAWGINGFASVAASPLALMLSMSLGFTWVIGIAALLYLLTGVTTVLWRE